MATGKKFVNYWLHSDGHGDRKNVYGGEIHSADLLNQGLRSGSVAAVQLQTQLSFSGAARPAVRRGVDEFIHKLYMTRPAQRAFPQWARLFINEPV
jgi:hypothetical protein